MEINWYFSSNPERRGAAGPATLDKEFSLGLARTIDRLGFAGALVAGGPGGADLWNFSAFMAAATRRMNFIIAQHPGVFSPLQLAQLTATLDHFSEGRVIINVVNGADQVLVKHGVFLDHDERYALADEYWGVWRRLVSGETVDFEGRYVRLRGAKLAVATHRGRIPQLYFGGSSPAALRVAARHVDTYLSYGEPPGPAAEKIAEVARLAAGHGRTLKYGLRIDVIVRETEAEAWSAAQRFYDGFDRAVIAQRQREIAANGSIGQQRMISLSGVGNRLGDLPKDAREFEIHPGIWAGECLLKAAVGTSIVGDPRTVADRLLDYRAAGFDCFILGGLEPVADAHRVTELVFPLLRKAGALAPAPEAEAEIA